MHKLAFVLAAAMWLCGCAGSGDAPDDPYESTNRQLFDFNMRLDRNMLRPTAEKYVAYVPEDVRDAIHNALENLNAPAVFANDLLQGQPRLAGQTAGRFVINSTVGIAGLFDVGARAGIPAHQKDFGQTLAVWGVGQGAYLMAPLLGPVYPRDAAGQLVDFALDPTLYVPIKGHVLWVIGRKYVSIVDARARNLETLDEIERDSIDFYAATRSLYRQHRENEIRNGTPPP